jgi:hypothetical protein
MTDEQILQLAENHLTFEKWEDICWKADTLQLLKFALAIHENGYNKGYDRGCEDGYESAKVSNEMNTWSSDDD